ncbi:glycosyltransferase family 4 protein [Paenibacillus lutrae]|nr:glycosyltransferase family 4 protein [Paenibacillus lutrae]
MMKWAMLLGSPDISGGTYVIFEHAIRISKSGVEVTIITEDKVDMARLQWHPEAKSLIWKTFKEIDGMLFDVCIATWWKTVFDLHRVNALSYVYFVQSIESRFYSEQEKPLRKLVESTYKLPLHIITEARWIKDYLFENHNQKARLVLNGVRKDIYKNTGERVAERTPGKVRVLVEGPIDVPFKNVSKTIEICKQSKASEIWLLTSSPVERYPGVDKVFSRVPIFKTPEIYGSCDVIVKLSYVEGMFGPPLEMFHCGGTSITYNVTGHDEYIVNGVNGLVADRDDDDQVLKYINNLVEDKALLQTLKDNAMNTAHAWPSWEESAAEFKEAVVDIIKNELSVSRSELQNQSSFLFDWYVIAEDYRIADYNRTGSEFKLKLKKYVKTHHPTVFEILRKIKFNLLIRRR